MCGRFVRDSSIELIAERFRIGKLLPEMALPPSYNVAPTQDIIIVNNRGDRQMVRCRWGFVPSWATDISIGSRMINARAETVATKPSFKNAFRKQRCLIVANGFFEWKKVEKHKTPMYISLKSGEPFGFAGLYNVWTAPTGEKTCSCTIITTTANEAIESIHDRMPVIIPRNQEDKWLDPEQQEADQLLELLKPYSADKLDIWEVSTKVNMPGYNAPDTIKTVGY